MQGAKEAFSRGQQSFDEGEYAIALKAFEESLASFPHFRTIFNMALCHEKLGNTAEAVALFEQYVNWPSEVPNREDVRQKIEKLRELLPPEPEPEPEPESEPTPDPVPQQEPGPDLIAPGWITLGVGAAGIVVSGVMLGMAQRKKSEMDSISGVSYEEKKHETIIEDGATYERIGWILGGVGIAAVAAGTVMLLVSDRDEDDAENVEEIGPVAFGFGADGRGGSITAVWSF